MEEQSVEVRSRHRDRRACPCKQIQGQTAASEQVRLGDAETDGQTEVVNLTLY